MAALGLLGATAAAHPELRLVDFVPFAGRARRLLDGQDLLSPRYPVGYPALLAAGKLFLGDVLVAGKVLAVAAGVAAVLAAGRWLGPAAGLWLLVQLPLLTYGTTEGTDMPAVAAALWALALALPGPGRRAWPLAAGLLAGLALLMRYPAAVVAPAVLCAAPLAAPPGTRARALGWTAAGLVLATAPHWLAALLGAGPLLPDPSENAAIGAGPEGVAATERWWPGVLRAGREALSTWPARLGAVGLLVGLLRRDGRALSLLCWGLLHLGVLGLFFANPRLVLPATVAATLGLAFLVPRTWLLPAAALVLWTSWPAAREPEPGTGPREELIAAASALDGPIAATSPWFHQRRPDGWIEGPILVKEAVPAGAHPGGITPPALLGWARARGIRYVVVDTARVQRTYPALRPLLRESVPGLREVDRTSGWRLLEIEPP